MRIKPEQLESALEKKLFTVYFVSGDEPLQVGEVADNVRNTAKNAGYNTREVFTVGMGFEWNELARVANSLSIFAEKKLIDIRMSTAKSGVEGSKALINYCQRLPKDTLLLVTAPKLEKSALKSKWIQSIDQIGTIIQVWPLNGAELIQWLQRRSKKRGLNIEVEAIKILASRVEGNLLVASQEIEKLYVFYGDTTISVQEIERVVVDNARFDVFKLTDCMLTGRVSRAVKILNGLKAESIAAPIVLWALTREARMLINIKTALNQGENKNVVYKKYQLWDKRERLVNAAVTRISFQGLQQALLLSSKADRQLKGREKGDGWETMLSLCLLFPSR